MNLMETLKNSSHFSLRQTLVVNGLSKVRNLLLVLYFQSHEPATQQQVSGIQHGFGVLGHMIITSQNILTL